MQRTSILKDVKVLAAMVLPSWREIHARIDASGAPTMRVAEGSLRERLKEIQARLSSARNEHAASRQAFEQAKGAVAKLTCSPAAMTGTSEWKSAEAAKQTLEAAEGKVREIEGAQIGVLEMLGEQGNHASRGRGGNGPRSGDVPAGDGFAFAAGEFDLEHGRDRVTLPLARLLPPAPMAAIGGVTINPSSGLTAPSVEQPFVQQPMDTRGLGGVFPTEQLDPGEAAIQDFRATSRETEGTIERDPIATSEKAKMALGIELVVDPLKQFALYIDSIPNKAFDYVETLGEVLENELGKQLTEALYGTHCISQILASAPPVGLKGADLLTQIRYGVKMARALGCSPTVIALSPDDAESLDLATTGTDKVLIFPTRAVGGASPVWGLTIREIPDLEAPIIMDAPVLGKLFLGSAVLRIDQATGLSTNECRVLLEYEALLNVRSPLGAFVLAAGEGE